MALQPEDDDGSFAPILGLVLICGLLMRSFASMLDWTPPTDSRRPALLCAGCLLAGAVALLGWLAYVSYADGPDWDEAFDGRWLMLWVTAAAAIRWLRHLRTDTGVSAARGSLLQQIFLAYRPQTAEAWASIVILYLGGPLCWYAVTSDLFVARKPDVSVEQLASPNSTMCFILMIIAVRGWAGSIFRRTAGTGANNVKSQVAGAGGG
jgi:hypothetical protein